MKEGKHFPLSLIRHKKVLAINLALFALIFSAAGIAFDFIKHGSLFPKAKHGLIKEHRGNHQSNSIAEDPESYSCFSSHAYFGYINSCTLTTSKGFLKEHSLKENKLLKKNNSLRILVVGGSVASHLTRRTSIEEVLQAKLNLDATLKNQFPGGISVFNAAHGGYKQPQQLIIISTLLSAGYQFEGIINVAGFNEIALPIAENFPQRISTILPRSQLLLESKEFVLHGPFRHIIAPLNLHPVTRAIGHLIAKRFATAYAATSTKPYQFDLPNSEQQAINQARRVWITSSQLSYAVATSGKAAYLEYIQPNQYVPNSKPLTTREIAIAHSPANEQPYRLPIENFYSNIKKSDFGIPEQSIADGRMIFREDNRSLYNDDCCHLNGTGMTLLANDIADHALRLIKQKPWIAKTN